jgi:hypothetical protein
MLAAIYDSNSSATGARATFDVWSRAPWIAGAAIDGRSFTGPIPGYTPEAMLRSDGASATAYVGARLSRGGWSLVPTVGVGVAWWRAGQIQSGGVNWFDDGTGPVTQASLMLTRAIGDRFELDAGGFGEWFPKGWSDPQPVGFAVAAGLGYRL